MSASPRGRWIAKLLIASLIGNALFVVGGLVVLHRKGGWLFIQQKIDAWQHPHVPTAMSNDGSYRNRVDHFHTLAALGIHSDIVFAGDSHPEKGDWSMLFGRPVTNRGIGGETLGDLRARLLDLLAPHPRLLILQIGSNDIDEVVLSAPTMQKLKDDYAALLNTIARDAPQTKVMVTSLLPVTREHTNGAASNDQLPMLNAYVLGLCAAHPGCIGADATTALSDADGNLRQEFSFDTTHLNGPGYAAWAAVLRPLVDQAMGSISIASP
ncbi:MAG: GDSL-type esterase/lipase family protein [Stagnimonas sp.]|nr:GDSL-type esterase/lipase family protein [Stagnimonas sp.]